MGKKQELRLGCQHCSAQFHTQWERAEHERRDHLVIVKQDAPNYGFVSTPTGVPPEQLIHIDSTGRYVLNALGQYVGTLVYETADPARRSSSDEAEVVRWVSKHGGNLAYMSDSGPVWEGGDALHREAAAAIERLLAERDEARAETENERVHNAELFSRAFAAEAQRDKLKAALKPFACAADIFDFKAANRPSLDDDPLIEWEDHRVGVRRIELGDFRRARQALQDTP